MFGRCGSIVEMMKNNQALLNGGRHTFSNGGGGGIASVLGLSTTVATGIGLSFAYSGLQQADRRAFAFCDAGLTPSVLTEDVLAGIRTATETIFRHDTLSDTKEYSIELKPIFSAFQMRPFTMCVIRSFLLFYLPLLQPKVEDEDADFPPIQEPPVDYIEPFKKSVIQIAKETTIVTTRRVLERCVAHECSQRTAWKLLKDVPTSALRKSSKGMPFYTYTFCVSKTTLKGHFLAIAASWLVHVGIECYRCVRDITKTESDEEGVEIVVYKAERAKVLGKRVCGITVRCGASLVFASIGAGIGATLLRPTTGQSLGCLLGDMVGPIVVSLCLANVPQLEF